MNQIKSQEVHNRPTEVPFVLDDLLVQSARNTTNLPALPSSISVGVSHLQQTITRYLSCLPYGPATFIGNRS